MTKKSRKDIDFDSVAIEQNDDILFITVAKYKLFLKHKDEGGLDAKALLDHYMFTARMQHTQSIKANDYYVMHGLGWGVRKLKRSKALLRKLGMIEYVQRRREDGTMGENYVVIRMSGGSNFVPPVQETVPPVDPPSGDDNQMLKQENEMLKQENEMLKQENKVSRDIAFNTLWIEIKNFIKNQTLNPSVKSGCIQSVPRLSNPDIYKVRLGKVFTEPTEIEVKAYLKERSISSFTANQFIDFYAARGWLIGKNKMKDWKAAVRTWESRAKSDPKRPKTTEELYG